LLFFCPIKGDVGLTQNIGSIPSILRKKGDPDASANFVLYRSGFDRLLEFFDYPQRDL
jgi:hypothetical protein